jgi:hypothetical protein
LTVSFAELLERKGILSTKVKLSIY